MANHIVLLVISAACLERLIWKCRLEISSLQHSYVMRLVKVDPPIYSDLHEPSRTVYQVISLLICRPYASSSLQRSNKEITGIVHLSRRFQYDMGLVSLHKTQPSVCHSKHFDLCSFAGLVLLVFNLAR